MDSSQYAELFLTESREHVSAINHSLLELERGAGGTEPVGSIFRSVHTIKGMSATMGYTAVATLSHELETLLDGVRRGVRAVDATLMELLFQSADVLESAIEDAWDYPGVVVLDFRVEREANVFPIVPQGRSIGEMMVDAHTHAAATDAGRHCGRLCEGLQRGYSRRLRYGRAAGRRARHH